MNPWQASRRMKEGHGTYEEVVVHVSSDDHIAGDIAVKHAGLIYASCALHVLTLA